jgi:hypothetical protein
MPESATGMGKADAVSARLPTPDQVAEALKILQDANPDAYVNIERRPGNFMRVTVELDKTRRTTFRSDTPGT